MVRKKKDIRSVDVDKLVDWLILGMEDDGWNVADADIHTWCKSCEARVECTDRYCQECGTKQPKRRHTYTSFEKIFSEALEKSTTKGTK